MRLSEGLAELERSCVAGSHLCNESVHEMCSLLVIPRSAVSGVTAKWKRLGATGLSREVADPVSYTAGPPRAERAQCVKVALMTSC